MVGRDPGAAGTTGGHDAQWRVLRAGLAVAVCFHVLGNARLAGVRWSLALGVAAALVLVLPRARWPIAVLGAAVWGGIWHEAPFLGNHWLLTGLVLLAILVALLGRGDGATASALPAARAVVLAFYAFAAFAKLNGGFFEPATSCATFYLGQGVESWGLPDPTSAGAVRWAAILGTVVVEASIPVLLLVRRTRTAGVVLALVFHGLVALDRTHQFFDFSSLLSVVFVTFLPASVLTTAARPVARRAGPVVRRFAAPLAALLAGAVGAVAADRNDPTLARDVGWWAWQVLAVVGIGSVILAVVRSGWERASVAVLPRGAAATFVLVVVLANGVAPYLELKTGAAWNMYANLVTADGDSNHFVVRATLPLTGAQDDLVEVVSSNDGALALYRDFGQRLPVRTLRAYLQEHRGVTAELRIGGERVLVRSGEPLPDRLGPPVSEVVARLLPLRAVSVVPGPPCQDAYLPAT